MMKIPRRPFPIVESLPKSGPAHPLLSEVSSKMTVIGLTHLHVRKRNCGGLLTLTG